MPPAHYHTMTNAISVCIESSERTADFSLSRVESHYRMIVR